MSADRLAALARDAAACERCPLYRNATQTVFGEGPATAAIMLVGEQPGDQEDREGRPFVGPAGRVLDQALIEAGLDRTAVYLTNAVKHFKHEQHGTRRLHKRPNRDEVRHCRWWLDQELAAVEPELIVALGVTAAEAVTGRAITLSRERGHPIELAEGRRGLVTIHPSAILRMPGEEARQSARAGLVEDLRLALELVSRR